MAASLAAHLIASAISAVDFLATDRHAATFLATDFLATDFNFVVPFWGVGRSREKRMSALGTTLPPPTRNGATPAPGFVGRPAPARNGHSRGRNGAGPARNGPLASVGWVASIDSTMQRVMIQMEPSLLERAKRAARERGVSFPQLIREALARELALSATPVEPLSCVGVVSTGGEARRREYRPEAWR